MVIFRKKIAGLSASTLERFVLRARRAVHLRGTVNVLVTNSSELRSLNRRFRGADKATDVLSFPSPQVQRGKTTRAAGDVAISADIARKNAARLGHSLADEVKILALHGILHLAGFDHERDNGEMARKESRLRRQLKLEVGLIEREREVLARDRNAACAAENGMNWGVALALIPLLALLALASYVDRVYQEIGKFLSREFQDNIDVFEQKVEPDLHVSRARASLSMSVLKQLTTATIALLVGFAVFGDQRWSVYEILQAAISLILIIIVFNQFLPFVFFSRTNGAWLIRWTWLLTHADLPGAARHDRSGLPAIGGVAHSPKHTASSRKARPRPWMR